jgi:peptidoglycan/LPS O-acetylase OafA/YrhL
MSAPPRPRWYALELLDNRYPALHGLRVLAILSVIQFHVTWIFSGEHGIFFDSSMTAVSLSVFFGMDLFFILSGFLIGSILFHAIESAGGGMGWGPLRRFYLRRVFRTFPSYYLVLTVLVLTTVLSDQQRAHLWYEYTYLTNFADLGRRDIVMFWGWSLGLEEQFYLVVPIFLIVLTQLRSDRARVLLLVGLCLVAAAIRLSIYFRHYPWTDLALYGALYFRTYTRFDTLIVGILLALVHRRWGPQLTVWLRSAAHRALLAIPALACLWVLAFPSIVGDNERVQVLHVFAWGTLTGLMYFPTLLLLLHGDGWIGRALSWRPFRYLATLGYGVYLVHIPIVDDLVVPFAHTLDKRHIPKPLLWSGAFLVTTICSLALAYVLHVLVEKPALRIRDRLAG